MTIPFGKRASAFQDESSRGHVDMELGRRLYFALWINHALAKPQGAIDLFSALAASHGTSPQRGSLLSNELCMMRNVACNPLQQRCQSQRAIVAVDAHT